ncbi:MAG: LapA family protein [Deltaproteobacteria bacterium]|nr:MAG: LapA family protein [Deltaproteobacteria bacterium]
MGNYIKGTVLVIVLLFLTTFGVKNSQVVGIKYYFGFLDFNIPLYGLAYICLLMGFLIGIATGIVKRFQQNRRVNELRHEIKTLEKKVSNNVSPSDKPVRLLDQEAGVENGIQTVAESNRK